MTTPMTKDDVEERLQFAGRRLSELLSLNGGNLPGADGSERQQLVQEFFFHLVGATEVLAQLVNEKCGLGIDTEYVTVHSVSEKLPSTDSIKSKMASLHVRTRGQPLPAGPYGDDGYIFRILNYRHQVTHRRRNPFLFRKGSLPTASLLLDPRDANLGPSTKSAQDEMQYMFKFIQIRCNQVLASL